MKIFAQKGYKYTEQELRDMALLLVKGGYTVKFSKVKSGDKTWDKCVEFTTDDGEQNE